MTIRHRVQEPARLGERVAGRGAHAARNPWIERLARAGFLARGVLYVVIGILAIDIATGKGGKNASQKGAIHTIAAQPFGKVLLTLLAIGLLGYALWQLIRGLLGQEQEGGQEHGALSRASDLLSAAAYAAMFYFTITTLTGSSSSSSGSGSSATASGGLLGGSGGTVIITVLGVALVGVGLWFVYRGWTEKFMEHFKQAEMPASVERVVRPVGKAGNIARGVVFGIVGGFMVQAAVTYNSNKPVSLDTALHKLANHPYGTFLLAIVAAGLICFGTYCFAEARYRRV